MESKDIIAVADCDSFFVSCEQNERPELWGKPVCVMGNNDRCIVARSAEAKKAGVRMGMPYFMAIKEAVGLVFRAATIAKGGEVMVLDMGEPVKIYDFAQKLITTFGDGRSEIVITGLRPGEKLYEELLANKDNTLPTENQKIFRAKVVNNSDYTEEYLANTVTKLPEMTPEQMVEFLKKSVPEYHEPEQNKEKPW